MDFAFSVCPQSFAVASEPSRCHPWGGGTRVGGLWMCSFKTGKDLKSVISKVLLGFLNLSGGFLTLRYSRNTVNHKLWR